LEYLQFGGFPEVVLNKNKEEIILNLYNDILTRDIIERYHVREITKLKTIAKYYLSNTGKLITLRSVSRGLNISLSTVERLTNYIKESMIITFQLFYHLPHNCRFAASPYTYHISYKSIIHSLYYLINVMSPFNSSVEIFNPKIPIS
jgi:Predicted ATPase (AAA+ superfamily)